MSSLFILNKAIDRAGGSGLPFYANPSRIFSTENNQFSGPEGLLAYPVNKIPAFQLHIEQIFATLWTTFEVKYIESKGGGVFTGYTYVIPNASVNMVKVASKNGVKYNIFEALDSYNIPEPPRCGRWIIQLTLDNNGLKNIYYSEEFLTFN